jgi:adenosylcobinamide-GDP ribazoletransferase
MPVLAANMAFARDDGLGKSAGRPDNASTMLAVGIAVVIALLCLPIKAALLAVLATAAGAAAIAALAWRQIGGITGDVFGAAEQVAESAVLLTLAAHFS